MKQLIFNTINKDIEIRNKGTINEKLYSLEDLDPKIWDFSLPTFVINKNKINNLMKNDKEFIDEFIKFYKKHFEEKILSFFLNLPEHFLIAGGFIVDVLKKTNIYERQNDIDIFIYDLNKEEAEEKINEFIKYLSNIINEPEYSIPKVYIVRSSNVISLLFGKKKIQFILRLYKSINEILYSFDIGASSVGFDGKHLYMTHLSKLCYELNCNIVDTTKLSPSYEYRLVKYAKRKNFNIIFPYLNIKKVDKKTLEIHDIKIEYLKTDGNKIYGIISSSDNTIKNSYDDYIPSYINYLDLIMKFSIRNIILNKKAYIYTKYKFGDDVFKYKLDISKNDVKYFYFDMIPKNMFNIIFSEYELYNKKLSNIEILNIKMYLILMLNTNYRKNKYFEISNVEEMTNKLLEKEFDQEKLKQFMEEQIEIGYSKILSFPRKNASKLDNRKSWKI